MAQSAKKLLLTSALVVSFSAYAVYQHFTAAPDVPVALGALTTPTPAATTLPTRSGISASPSATAGRAASSAPPTQAPASASAAPTAVPEATASATPPRAPQARPTATATTPPAQAQGLYKDGDYVGNPMDAYFGNVQVKAVVRGGQLTDVQFLDYPHDRRTSQRINAQAMPYLQTEAVQAQSAQVNVIGGATLTSQAYIRSLQSALAKAKS